MDDLLFDGAVVMPQLIVEIGWAVTDPDADGFQDGFILDVSLLDSATTLQADVLWTANSDVMSVTYKGGVDVPRDAIGAGTASITLDNESGAYDPTNTSSPFYAGGQVRPARQVRIRAAWQGVSYPLWKGHIVDFDFDMGTEPTCTLECSDMLDRLAGEVVPAQPFPLYAGDLTSQRLGRILDTVGVPSDVRTFSTGYTLMPGTVWGNNALAEMQATVLAEQGQLFVGNDGQLTFYNRRDQWTRAAALTPQLALSDDLTTTPTALIVSQINTTYGATGLINSWEATRIDFADPPTAVSQVAEDATSIGLFTRQSDTMDDLLVQTDADAAGIAAFALTQTKDPKLRVDSVQFDAIAQGQWTALLGLDMFDRISVRRQYSHTFAFYRELLVCGRTVTITPDPDSAQWQVTLSTADPYTGVAFRLNSSLLDGTDILIF